MHAIKFYIAEICDDVLNLFTTHAITEQHLVDVKSELPNIIIKVSIWCIVFIFVQI
jgi:hypothetical protein